MSTLDSDTFRDLIGRFATGVTVITARDGDTAHGTTASAVSSLSLQPPMLLICMNEQSATGRAVARSGYFAVNVLNEDQHDVAHRFATKHPDKFAGIPTAHGPSGQILLPGALATFECRVVDQVTGGTHTVFVAEVQYADGHAGRPLAYFRGRLGQLSAHFDNTAAAAPAATPTRDQPTTKDEAFQR